MKKKLISLLVLLMAAVTGAWAQDNRFFLEVSGTSATLKWGEPISNDNPSLYPGSSWKYQGNDWTDKSGITTITVDASCTNCSEDNISALFYKFVDLQTINNIENIKTDAVQYLGSMFQNCTSLQTLDLSSWNTENVTSMSSMFNGCSSLTTLDLSSFNTGKVNGMSYMFKDCSTLTTIYVGDGWSTDQLTSSSSSTNMFDGCVSLPNWDNASPVIDKTNAHTGDGGYLTYKASTDYKFTVAPCEYGSGTVKFFIDGKEVEGAYETNEGKTITMTITPDEGWVVDDTKVKAESYSTWEAAGAPSRRAPGNIQILGDVTLTKSTTAENTWTFTMPAASVLVSAGYIKSSTLYFDPADKTNLVKVTVDGTDRNLNGSKTVKIKRVDNVLEGTAVSLKANDGYKFRKVQVTKTDNGLKLTNPTVGQVIGSDGKNYAYASLPTGVTAVAKICYVSGNSGLALALADESSMMDWATAIETCAAHTPAFKGAEWKLASQDEWNNMKSAAGNYANLRNGFSSVGGTDMRSLQEETYWSSTEQVNSQNAWYMLNSGNWYRHDKSVTKYVRACLAF